MHPENSFLYVKIDLSGLWYLCVRNIKADNFLHGLRRYGKRFICGRAAKMNRIYLSMGQTTARQSALRLLLAVHQFYGYSRCQGRLRHKVLIIIASKACSFGWTYSALPLTAYLLSNFSLPISSISLYISSSSLDDIRALKKSINLP